MLRTLAHVFVASAVSIGAVWAEAAHADERPNIVLLISDDDDYENFGFMGNPRVHTPTLDALADRGTLFTTAHVPAPLCRPSLASILSGRLPQQHGIYCNYLERAGIGTDQPKLDPANSLPNRLKEAGYATYLTGSKYWEGDPRAMGFTHGDSNVSWQGFLKFVRQGQDDLFRFIDDEHGKAPMFIWWAPMIPHTPHDPPQQYAKLFADVDIPIPPYYEGDPERYVAAMRNFYAMGAWFDDGVAQLIEKLRQTGELDNTVFFFFVDNGWTIGKTAKNSATEKGLRTPMFVTWPGHVPEGKRLDGLARAIDLHATILDYAVQTPADGIESESLRPRIEGSSDAPPAAIFGAVFAHAAHAWPYDKSVPRSATRDVYALYARTDRWKYVLYTQDVNQSNTRYIWTITVLCDLPHRKRGDQTLFDLTSDPYEMDNLAADPAQAERVAEMRRQVLDWWRATGGGPLDVAGAAN